VLVLVVVWVEEESIVPEVLQVGESTWAVVEEERIDSAQTQTFRFVVVLYIL